MSYNKPDKYIKALSELLISPEQQEILDKKKEEQETE